MFDSRGQLKILFIGQIWRYEINSIPYHIVLSSVNLIFSPQLHFTSPQRCDVSLVVDGQGLPDAKQAYNIPEEFSQVCHGMCFS
jgi:hypothetical protein